jgi:hypothetical protein
MPTFAGILTDDEILSILEFLKSKWGDEERTFQWQAWPLDDPAASIRHPVISARVALHHGDTIHAAARKNEACRCWLPARHEATPAHGAVGDLWIYASSCCG